jgi:hypothetical protein
VGQTSGLRSPAALGEICLKTCHLDTVVTETEKIPRPPTHSHEAEAAAEMAGTFITLHLKLDEKSESVVCAHHGLLVRWS